jgi:acetamidase/formamidase
MVEYSVDFQVQRPHDVFDRSLAPILEIDPGDSVVFRTLDASWGRNARKAGVDLPGIDLGDLQPEGHALCGPVFVRGAFPGSVLEIAIDEVRPERWGWTWAGPRPWYPGYDMGIKEDTLVGWDIDGNAGLARDTHGMGITIPIQPFMGVMGNALSESGRHPTQPPRRVGGNIDCRELQVGSSLYLPIEVEGALFSVGDGHAAQGDGEVSQTAVECSMQRVRLTFRVRTDLEIDAPEADTPAGHVTLGLGETLDEAAQKALETMLTYLERTHALRRNEAMVIASVAVSLRITQVVNRTLGVHAVLARDALKQSR